MQNFTIPSNPLRSVPLVHQAHSPSRAAELDKNEGGEARTATWGLTSNVIKWKKFGVDVEDIIAPSKQHQNSSRAPGGSNTPSSTASAPLRVPLEWPSSGGVAVRKDDCTAQANAPLGCKARETTPPHGVLNDSRTQSLFQPADFPHKKLGVDQGLNAFQQLTEIISRMEQERKCGHVKKRSEFSHTRQSKPKNSSTTTNESSAQPKKRKRGADTKEGNTNKLERKKRSKVDTCAAAPDGSFSSCASGLFQQSQAPATSPFPTRTPFEWCTSHQETDALFTSMEAALLNPDRIQAPPLYVGLLIRHSGVQYSNFTPYANTLPWRKNPSLCISLVDRFCFRWKDRLYHTAPELGIALLVRVLKELAGVEVITYDAPVLLIPLLHKTQGSLFTHCVSDVRVMAWMRGSLPSTAAHSYLDLEQAILESASPPRPDPRADPLEHLSSCVFHLAPLYRTLYASLGSRSLLQPFLRQEKRIALLIGRMKFNGMLVDLAAVRRIKEKCLLEMESAKKRAAALLPSLPEFNIQSADQCRHALYEVLQLGSHLPQTGDGLTTTKTGKLSTAEESLRCLEPFHELPNVILQYRKAAKIIQNYIDGMMSTAVPYGCHEDDPTLRCNILHDVTPACCAEDSEVSVVDNPKLSLAILHPNFIQEGTDTGRLSCVEPNLQNLPRAAHHALGADCLETEDSIAFRDCFIAKSGYVLVSIDYEQIELRLLAHLSGDAQLIDALTGAADIHSSIAMKVFNKSSVSSDERNMAKRVVFGILYGAGLKTIASQLQISMDAAARITSAVQSCFPLIDRYRQKLVEEAKVNGCVRTLSGRLRMLPDLKGSATVTQKRYAERQAFNTVIQGSAADVVKLAMLAVEKSVLSPRAGKEEIELLSHIHDELVFSVRRDVLESVVPLLQDAMTTAVSLRVPLPVVVKFGASLGSMTVWSVENDLGLFSFVE